MTFSFQNRSEPPRVDSINRVPTDIGIEVEATSQANGVGGDIPSSNRIIISMPVIMQPGFSVKVLARKTEVVDDGVGLNLSLTIGQISCLPDHSAGRGDQLLGRAQMIVDEIMSAKYELESSPNKSSISLYVCVN